MFKKELELIEGLMSLYPVISEIPFISSNDIQNYFHYKKINDLDSTHLYAGWWIYNFCKYQVNMHLPQFEEFLKHCDEDGGINSLVWYCYKRYFKIYE